MAGQHPDGDFAWKVANGRGAMPAWKEILSERDIWHVVNYIQSLEHPDKTADAHHAPPGDDHHKNPGHDHADHQH